MHICETQFHDLKKCYELSIPGNEGDCSLIVTADFGPRIVGLRINNGENILFYDTDKTIRYKDWFIHGGHRLWISPESDDTYAAENTACNVEVIDEREITVSRRFEKPSLEKKISITEDAGRFCVTHTVINRGECLYPGAIWALTCVNPKGTLFFPWGGNGAWSMKKIIYWKNWMSHRTTLRSSQYVEGDDLFLIRPTGETGKVGTAGHEGFIGVTSDAYTFVKQFDRIPTADYPDDNCAIEAFTSEQFMELETLSPRTTFFPGEPFTHRETWLLTGKGVDPENGESIRALLK